MEHLIHGQCYNQAVVHLLAVWVQMNPLLSVSLAFEILVEASHVECKPQGLNLREPSCLDRMKFLGGGPILEPQCLTLSHRYHSCIWQHEDCKAL